MIIDKVNDYLNSHSSSTTLLELCFYIKKNIHRIPNLSIDDISKESLISKGQVSKCIRKLDYENYEEFKNACIQYLDLISKRKKFLNPHQSFETNVMYFTKDFIQNIQYMINHINLKLIQKLIQDIKQIKYIYMHTVMSDLFVIISKENFRYMIFRQLYVMLILTRIIIF